MTTSSIHKEAFHAALIVSLLVAFAVSDVTSSPSIVSCNNPSSLMQCGTTSCTLSPAFIPPYLCTVTVNFSPSFNTVPRFMSAMWNGCQSGTCHFETFTPIPIASLTMQSDNGETWTSMPVASTEIYGTTNHESSILMPAGVDSAYFNVLCIQGSTSSTAKLRPEYSTDGSTWHELAVVNGLLDASVDASDCSFTASGVEAITVGPSGIPASLLANMATTFRVVGFNGSGLGDTVIFNNIQIVLAIRFSNPFYVCIDGVSGATTCGITPPTKSSMTITIAIMANPGNWVVGVNWIAIE